MPRIHTLALGAALVVGLTATAAPVASAQTKTRADSAEARGKRGPARQARHLFRGIDLSQQQKDQIQVIRERYRPQFQALREKARTSRRRNDAARPDSTARIQMRDLMQRQRAELRAALTPEQRPTFDRNLQQLQERMRERQEARRDGRRERHQAGQTRPAGR